MARHAWTTATNCCTCSTIRCASILPYGKPLDDFNDFDESAKALMYSRDVTRAFNYSTGDSGRYGNTSFGNACLLATKILDANLGTRFAQITLGGWDMHTNIYGANGRGGLYTLGKTFDD